MLSTINSSSPWLSVIVPIYNAEKHIEKCIKSILNQSFTNFELLLIDDGSTDFSSNICRKYEKEDTRVKFYKKDNEGSFHTRCFGIKKAIGEYITFCDSDDYYSSKNAFATIFNMISKYNAEMLQFGIVKKYNHLSKKVSFVNNPTLLTKSEFLSQEYPNLLCNNWPTKKLIGYVHNKVYKRQLCTSITPPSNPLFFGDDVVANLHFLENCNSVLFIPDTLYTYQQSTGGTKKFNNTHMYDLNTVKLYQLEFLDRWQGNNDDKKRIKNCMYAEIAAWFFTHITQGINILSEDELKEFIMEILNKPSFLLAQKYYLEENNEDWEAVNLIRKADPVEYIKAAKQSSASPSLKSKVVSFARNLYRKI